MFFVIYCKYIERENLFLRSVFARRVLYDSQEVPFDLLLQVNIQNKKRINELYQNKIICKAKKIDREIFSLTTSISL